MTISRWLRIKADEELREIARAEGRAEDWKTNWTEGWTEGWSIGWKISWAEGVAEGIAQGRAKANKAWDEWLARMQAAQRDGKPFDEPPPSSR